MPKAITQAPKPFSITPIYDILLRGSKDMPIGLYHLHSATAAQLCRLHYSQNSIKLIKARLKTLVDERYIQEDWQPTKRLRSPYYYALAVKGIEYLAEAGLDTTKSFRASKEVDKHSLFIEHHLGVNDIVISAALLKVRTPDYELASFIHERELRHRAYKTTWRGERFSIIPDAFLDFRQSLPDGSHRRMPVLLEHDCGTEAQRKFRSRIRAYILLLKSEAYKEWFGVKAITIAFTTFVGEQRVAQMRDWTRQELAATREPKALGLSFLFTNQLQPPEPEHLWLDQCWYTPYDEGQQPLSLLAD